MSDQTLTSAAKVGAALDRLSVSVPGGASMKTSTDLITAAAETIDTLTAERDAALARVAELTYCLTELTAQVHGECSVLLDGGRGGDGALSVRIDEALERTP